MPTDRRTDPIEDLADAVTGILIGASPVRSDVDSSVPVPTGAHIISLAALVFPRVAARKRRPG